MKYSKILSFALLISLTMTSALFSGCGEKSTSSKTDAPAKATETSISPATDGEVAMTPTEEPATTATATNSQTATATLAPTPTQTENEENEKEETEKIANIIVLAGQSNAVGATLTSPLQKAIEQSRYRKFRSGYSNIKIAYFAEAGGANGAAGTFRTNIDYTKGNIQPVKNIFVKTNLSNSWTTQMFGPEIGIAEYLNEKYPDETFYIVKVAKGGVSVADSWEDGGYCYEKLKETMNICCTSLEAEGYTPQIFSICWIQGENEAAVKSTALKYDKIVSGVAERMRNDFAKYSIDNKIAFIDAGISDSPLWTYYKEVNAGKEAYAKTSELNYYFSVIDAGLEYKNEPANNPDLAHYDSTSVIKLGNLLGEYIDTAYKKIVK